MIRPAALAVIVLFAAAPVAANEVLDKHGMGKDVQAAIERMNAGRVAVGLKDLETLSKAGRTDAAEFLGELTRAGAYGVRADPRKACRYFTISARDRGDGRHNLAFCFETGEGGKKDLAEAVRLYGEAGEMGFAQAWCAKGNLLINGAGAPKDVEQGVALCQKGAEGGSADAQTDLGNFYLQGEIVPKDAAMAAYWYEKAVAQKQANAALVLGQMYGLGVDLPKDTARAVQLWTIAYENGRADAAYLLGIEAAGRAFDEGPPAKVDPDALAKGIHWLEIAAREDYDPKTRTNAAKVLDSLRELDAAVKRRKAS